MKALITGSTGFAGTHLIALLAQSGCRTLGLSRCGSSQGSEESCDVLDFDSLLSHVCRFRPDLVFHLAGLSMPSHSLQDPRNHYIVNVQGTVNLLEALRVSGVRARVLLVSSSEIYGNPETPEPINESATIAPLNPYGSSKWLSEKIGLQFLKNYEIPVIIARPFNHAGTGQKEGFVLADFSRQIVLNELGQGDGIVWVGNLEPVLDFVDARDVVRAYHDLAVSGTPGEAYNICSGKGTSIQELLEMALRCSTVPLQVGRDDRKWRPYGKSHIVGDFRKLNQALRWTPRYSLRETVENTLNWWREILGARIDPK